MPFLGFLIALSGDEVCLLVLDTWRPMNIAASSNRSGGVEKRKKYACTDVMRIRRGRPRKELLSRTIVDELRYSDERRSRTLGLLTNTKIPPLSILRLLFASSPVQRIQITPPKRNPSALSILTNMDNIVDEQLETHLSDTTSADHSTPTRALTSSDNSRRLGLHSKKMSLDGASWQTIEDLTRGVGGMSSFNYVSAKDDDKRRSGVSRPLTKRPVRMRLREGSRVSTSCASTANEGTNDRVAGTNGEQSSRSGRFLNDVPYLAEEEEEVEDPEASRPGSESSEHPNDPAVYEKDALGMHSRGTGATAHVKSLYGNDEELEPDELTPLLS